MRFAQVSVAALLTLTVTSVMSTSSSSFGRFAFDYAIVGDARSKPLQVFDDGQRTYFQFRSGEPIPALMSASGDRLFMPQLEGPYVVIAGVPRDIVAQMGLARARITHASLRTNAPQSSPDGRSVAPAVPAMQGVQVASLAPVAMGPALSGGTSSAVAPSATVPNGWRDNSYATPRRGDQVEWAGSASGKQSEEAVLFLRGQSRLQKDALAAISRMARRMANAGRVTVVGRDDESYKEGLAAARAQALADALVNAGVSRNIIEVHTGVEQPDLAVHHDKRVLVPSQVRWAEMVPVESAAAASLAPINDRAIALWDVRAADSTVDKMLSRWASEAHWQLVWRSGPSIPLTGDAQVNRPGFVEAASYVITQSRNAGYRIKATAYSNRTLVIESD